MWSIDRFEGEYALCENTVTEERCRIPKAQLPPGARGKAQNAAQKKHRKGRDPLRCFWFLYQPGSPVKLRNG